MSKFRVGLIRVLTTEDKDILNSHGRIIGEKFQNIEVISKCIENQREGIHSEKLKMEAIPKIIETAKSFNNIDMILVSCAEDPGVKELRDIFDIPVTGAGETTVSLSIKYGSKIGVLGIIDEAPTPYLELIKDKIVAVEKPKCVESTLDLMTEQGRKSCIESAIKLRELGCEVIALACTGMATVGMTKELEEAAGIPVIDPVLAQGLFVYFEYLRRFDK